MKRSSLINFFGNVTPSKIMETVDTGEYYLNASRDDDYMNIDERLLFDLSHSQEVESVYTCQDSSTENVEVRVELIDRENGNIEYRNYIGFIDDNPSGQSSALFTETEARKIENKIMQMA